MTNATGFKLVMNTVMMALLSIILSILSLFMHFSPIAGETASFDSAAVDIDLNGGNKIFDNACAVLVPGEEVRRNFTITNSGNVAVWYRLIVSDADGPLADHATIAYYDGGSLLYEESVKGSAAVDGYIGSMTPGQQLHLTAVLKLTGSDILTMRTSYMTFDITAQAVQLRNNPNRDFG